MQTNGNTLHLDESDKRFLGVCSGFARYMDMPVLAIRLIYAVACLIWPTLIIMYFVMYWCMKRDPNPGRLKSKLSDSKTANHFRKLNYRRPLYRNPDDARVAGVCSGVADYLDINSFVVRLTTVLSFFIFGPFTFFAYIVMWMVMQKRPEGCSYEEAVHREAEATDVRSLQECSSLLSRTESRLRDVEAFITSKRFSLHCEINRI